MVEVQIWLRLAAKRLQGMARQVNGSEVAGWQRQVTSESIVAAEEYDHSPDVWEPKACVHLYCCALTKESMI